MATSSGVIMADRMLELQRLFHTAEGADVTFVCGQMTRKVHSFVLQLGSRVLGTMCNGPFQEGITKRIEVKEHDSFLIYRMLSHLYTFDYPGRPLHYATHATAAETSFISELHTHVQMYALGDEYDIKDLKNEALEKFQATMKGKRGKSDECTSVLEVISTIYSTTPESDRGLRDIVVAFGAERVEKMGELLEMEEVTAQVPRYTIEVARASKAKKSKAYTKVCERGRCPNTDKWKYDRVRCECGHYQFLTPAEMADAS